MIDVIVKSEKNVLVIKSGSSANRIVLRIFGDLHALKCGFISYYHFCVSFFTFMSVSREKVSSVDCSCIEKAWNIFIFVIIVFTF